MKTQHHGGEDPEDAGGEEIFAPSAQPAADAEQFRDGYAAQAQAPPGEEAEDPLSGDASEVAPHVVCAEAAEVRLARIEKRAADQHAEP